MSIYVRLLVFVLGTCWGSFLNVLAVRGLQSASILTRSRCHSCNHLLAWWELIPIVSWIMLKGRCSHCYQPISAWYPLIEYLCGLWMWSLTCFVPLSFFPAFFVLSSALLVTMRTDGEHFLILRWCTLGIIPWGFMAAYFGLLPISLTTSVLGCLFGGGYLAFVRTLFFWWKNYHGLGEGDIELLAAIGSYIGPIGVLYTLIISSCLAIVYSRPEEVRAYIKNPAPTE